MKKKQEEVIRPWFEESGPETDVIVSTRIRLARNLANYPFVLKLSDDDSSSVKNLINDAFNGFDTENKYHPVMISDLDCQTLKILKERGFIPDNSLILDESLIFLGADGNLITTVNVDDHYRIASFSSGLNIFPTYEKASFIDRNIQDYVQVAYSNEFGYLTSAIKDCGSGMKVSVLLHLPSVSMEGLLEDVLQKSTNLGIRFENFFGGKNAGSSLGAFYLVSKNTSFNGNEDEHLKLINTFCTETAELERKTRGDVFTQKPTVIRDRIFKSVADMKYSKFLNLREGIEIISTLKLGFDMKILTGAAESDFYSLLYRTQPGQLLYVVKTSRINFETDVNTDSLKTNRLRALIFQETFDKIEIEV